VPCTHFGPLYDCVATLLHVTFFFFSLEKKKMKKKKGALRLLLSARATGLLEIITATSTISSGLTIAPGRMNYLVVTYSSSTSFFLNGSTYSQASTSALSGALYLGLVRNADILLDELYFYSQVLSSTNENNHLQTLGLPLLSLIYICSHWLTEDFFT